MKIMTKISSSAFYTFVTVLLLLHTSNAMAQTNQPQMRKYGREHRDAQGNVIGVDSVTTFYWSNKSGSDTSFVQQFPDGSTFSFQFGNGGFGTDPYQHSDSLNNSHKNSPSWGGGMFGDDFFNFGGMPGFDQLMQQHRQMMDQHRQMMERLHQNRATTPPNGALPPTDKKSDNADPNAPKAKKSYNVISI